MKHHFDVLIVGAGLSGIGAAHHISTRTPWLSYAIFESRDAVGGTWDLFRYPGVRSDSDMFTLGYRFRPWSGQKAIADGRSIREYINTTASDDGTTDHIHFGVRVIRASWSTADALWTVTAESTVTGEQFDVTCRFVYSCTGYYRYDRAYRPELPGRDAFGGAVVHPQFWPEDLDYEGKRIVVIGSGATAVTLVPALAEKAGHVVMLQRSPSYIASVPASLPEGLSDRRVSAALRWFLALFSVATYQLSRRRPSVVKKLLRRELERSLPAGYDIDTHFTPDYEPWDQRMCLVPDGDLFKAISNGSATVITGTIDTLTDKGILLAGTLPGGEEVEADIIVTATGLELLFLGGIELVVDGAAIDPADRMIYRGTMIEGVPNLAFAFGYTNASWTLKCELSCDYVVRLLTRMHETGFRQCTPVNFGPDVKREPAIDLKSGYVQRAIHRFPKQGDAFPWRVHQNYLLDYQAMKLRSIDDGFMELTNRPPTRVRTGLSAAISS